MKLFVLLSLITLSSCAKKNAEMESAYTFGKVKINSTIKDERIFRWLDTQKDFNMSDDGDRNKTSAAQYYSKRKNELEIPEYYFYNNCRAEIVNDTLLIRIGSTTYLSDYGIKIKYKNGKFFTIPFHTSDIIDSSEPKEPKEIFFLRNRKLILDKYNYKVGDTVFGRIHTEIEEPERKDLQNKYYTIEHFADGYFRAKVGEL